MAKQANTKQNATNAAAAKPAIAIAAAAKPVAAFAPAGKGLALNSITQFVQKRLQNPAPAYSAGGTLQSAADSMLAAGALAPRVALFLQFAQHMGFAPNTKMGAAQLHTTLVQLGVAMLQWVNLQGTQHGIAYNARVTKNTPAAFVQALGTAAAPTAKAKPAKANKQAAAQPASTPAPAQAAPATGGTLGL